MRKFIVAVLLGMLVIVIGALLFIQHVAGAHVMLGIGMIIIAGAIVTRIVKPAKTTPKHM